MNQLVADRAMVGALATRGFTPFSSPPREIVALGGGTGLPTLLRGLRRVFSRADDDPLPIAEDRNRLTAIVTVTDDGGSSGALRQAYQILAPGDIRNCLLALSDGDSTLQALFDYRFNNMAGEHSLGNLILTALTLLEKDFPRAVERASELLSVRGKVLPSTADNVHLVAEFTDGTSIVGESRITAARRCIRRVSLVPNGVRALPQTLAAIAAADLIVLGPGSLYTSLIPTLLVPEIAEAIARSHAQVGLVANLMTEPGETDGYSTSDFLLAIREHAPQVPIHTVLLNKTPIAPGVAECYATEGAAPVFADVNAIRALGCQPVECDFLDNGPLVRHDPDKLARAVLALTMVQEAAA